MQLSEELILLSYYLERKHIAYIIKDDMILEKESYIELVPYKDLPVSFYQITEKGLEYIQSLSTIIYLCVKFIEYFPINNEMESRLRELLNNAFTSLQKKDLCIYLASNLEYVRKIAKSFYDT